MKQLERFLRLERARKDSETEVPLPPRRFATLEQARAAGPGGASHSAASLERFAPEPEPALELEAKDNDEPFVRCPHCGADSIRHAVVCQQCEARLDTDAVRAFNLKLWADITAARKAETEELRRRETLRSASMGRDAAAAEFAAREEARRELEIPSILVPTGWRRSYRENTSPGLLLVLAVGLPALVYVVRHGRAAVGGVIAGGLLVLLVVLAFRRLR